MILSEKKWFLIEPPLPIPETLDESKKGAEELRLKGNEQYVKKNLKAALEFYQQAADLDKTSPLTLSNMSAVYCDMKKVSFRVKTLIWLFALDWSIKRYVPHVNWAELYTGYKTINISQNLQPTRHARSQWSKGKF